MMTSMNQTATIALLLVCLTLPVIVAQRRTGGAGLKGNRTGSGLGIGVSGRVTNSSSGSGSSSGGINSLRNMNRGPGLSIGGTTSTTTLTPAIPAGPGNSENRSVSVGLIVPYSMFYRRDYERAVSNVMVYLQGKGKVKYDFLQKYRFTTTEVLTLMITVSPSPRGKNLFVKLIFNFFSFKVSAFLKALLTVRIFKLLRTSERYGESECLFVYLLR